MKTDPKTKNASGAPSHPEQAATDTIGWRGGWAANLRQPGNS